MTADPYKVLRQSGARNTAQIGCVGAGTFGLGLFMVTLHAAGLDPSLAGAGTGKLVVIYSIATFFMGVGALMLGVSIFKTGGQLADLEARLKERPESIVRAYRQVATKKVIKGGQSQRAHGQHMVVVQADDEMSWTINATAGQVTAILELIKQRNPAAEVRGLQAPGTHPARRG